jgi:RND superfamily putative drug exporter
MTPTSTNAKVLVLIAWLVLLMPSGALGGKLQSVTKNNVDAYLPGSAEATQVIKLQAKVRKDDSMLTIVSYERRSGITAADQAAARSGHHAARQAAARRARAGAAAVTGRPGDADPGTRQG